MLFSLSKQDNCSIIGYKHFEHEKIVKNKKVLLRNRLPHSKYSLCCSVFWGGGGLPHPAHPVLMGVPPSSADRGNPSQVRMWIPTPFGLDGVPLPVRTGWSNPWEGTWHQALGYPSPQKGHGTSGWKYYGVKMGYYPWVWTDRHLWKQYLPHSFRMRAVTISGRYFRE